MAHPVRRGSSSTGRDRCWSASHSSVPGVNDFLQAASIAVAGEVPLTALAHAVAPFPTRSELWLSFLEEYERQAGVSVHS